MKYDAQFLEECTRYLVASLALQAKTGTKVRVGKARVMLVMARRGYSTPHLDRKRKPMKGFEHLYDPDFPKPIDLDASYLEWWLDDLLAYKERKYGRKAA